MGDIKVKEKTHDAGPFDKAADFSKNVQRSYIKAKDTVKDLADDGEVTPDEYAEDKIENAARSAENGAESAVRKGADKFRENREKKREEDKPDIKDMDLPDLVPEESVKGFHEASPETPPEPESAPKIRVKEKEPGTVNELKRDIKTAERDIKTAERSSGRAIRTKEAAGSAAGSVEAGRKAAAETAKDAEKTAAAASKTAGAVKEAAAKSAQAASSAAKAAAEAVKNLITAAIAGGWTTVIIMGAAVVVMVVVGSVYGIFFSTDDDPEAIPVYQVADDITYEFQSEIDRIFAANEHDEIRMEGERVSPKEVIAFFIVRGAEDTESVSPVTRITELERDKILALFWNMTEIKSTVTKTEVPLADDDDSGGTKTIKTLTVTVSKRSMDEMADEYAFSDEQREELADLLSPEYDSMWQDVLYSPEDRKKPIILSAMKEVGNIGGAPYWSWYGFNVHVEWCACFVSWNANQCGYISSGTVPKYSYCASAVSWFQTHNRWLPGGNEPEPGMIIFFDWDHPEGKSGPQDGHSDHTGIVRKVEDGIVYTIEGNAWDMCRLCRYPIDDPEIMGYGIIITDE